MRGFDPDAPLTVGNGGFAFTCDITGLQTFSELHQRLGIPVETLSRWAWVSEENVHGYTLADASRNFQMPDGSTRPFPTMQSSPAGEYLRKNPRAHPLAQLALEWKRKGASPAITPAEINSPCQKLDLWRGIVTSQFFLRGAAGVLVETACAPDSDTLAVRITSRLVSNGEIRVRLCFPRGHDLTVKNTPRLDWSEPDSHVSALIAPNLIERRIHDLTYYAVSSRSIQPLESHHFFSIDGEPGETTLEFTIYFGKTPPATGERRTVAEVFEASAAHWRVFWENTAAVDFSGSAHPLAPKIEERIILSRYLMAAQMAGDVPPQESGLTCNTWYGKHHTEMIWWHAAHFALWGSDNLLARNLQWYQSQLPAARELARDRGLKGARWAKMTGNIMRESPGGPPLIVWNQPHMVYLCELLYRNNPSGDVLEMYRDLVFETAECLAGMVHWNEANRRYDLGPPLWIAQEIYDQATSRNPSFELYYWRWALGVAREWRARLGLGRDAHWDHVIENLAPPPRKDGKYVALESYPDTWDNIDSRHDHPMMLAPIGMLPGGPDIDRETMERTLDAVLDHWDWETKIWGWDYPMIAMTAARLGRPDTAVEILMREGPNNRYLPTGHCPQRSDEKMPPNPPPGARKREIAVYLPANGAFLAAIALMVAGWDGCEIPFPGFPKDGAWTIRAEGLRPLP